ncbi:MAG TPA: ribosome small subunit-dependent GTPase A [Eubacteriaceae bacterium]|nr:ribosome small subunit-dependent GTPase A [Eubacteriaceae bacterium]
MEKGIIIKGIGGFYYVLYNNNDIVECKARGIFRKDKITPMVGDNVKFKILKNSHGIIEEILPRRNQLERPPVSNVDQGIIVFSTTNPNPNFQLLDRFLVLGEKQNLKLIICINKVDLINSGTINNKIVTERYEKTGYPIIFTSIKEYIGIKELKKHLSNHISVFAGPSGVGKSSLLNEIDMEYNLATNVVSEKINRGKHTTRHVELLPYGDNGYVVDTPGFSSLSIEDIKKDELMYFFPEYREFLGKCKFSSCIHIHEPNCAIIEALHKGNINKERYDSYSYFLEEIEKSKLY